MKKLFRFVSLCFRIEKRFFLYVLLNAIVSAALTVYNVYSVKLIIDALEIGELIKTVIFVALVVAINLLINFLTRLFERLINISRNSLDNKVQMLLSSKLMDLPYHYLEDPKYLDLKERAFFAINNFGAIQSILQSISSLITTMISITGFIAIIITFDWLILTVILISIGLSVLVNILSMKMQYKFRQRLIPINRKLSYYVQTILNDKKGKEYRLSNLGDLMVGKYIDYQKDVSKEISIVNDKAILLNGTLSIINYVQTGFTYALIAIRSFVDHIGIGNFSLYIGAAAQLSQTANQLFDTIVNLRGTVFYLDPLLELLSLESEYDSGTLELGDIETIEFENVSFKYPKTDNYILKNISFIINRYEKISMVGLNGSGKTTMIKLLMRLYPVLEGRILVNGIDIKEYQVKSYFQAISAVFQDYKLFAYSIFENIAANEKDREKALKAIDRISLSKKISSLENGMDTNLSKAYSSDGVNLSGGEEQKIAIARALYKDSSFIALDEPTSALDPIAESEIYSNFNSLVLDKTAIYISHRMSSSVFCDKVLVIDDGKVVAFDKHKSLMKNKDSLYYKLFSSQAENYQH